MQILMFVVRILLLAAMYLFIYHIVRTALRSSHDISADQRFRLVIVNPGDSKFRTGESVQLSGDITVGQRERRKKGFWCIDDRFVSREHARFFWRDGALHIMDLGSENRTCVNGDLIGEYQPFPLQGGDVINLGRVELEMILPSREN